MRLARRSVLSGWQTPSPIPPLNYTPDGSVFTNDNWKDTQETEIEATGQCQPMTSNPPSWSRWIPASYGGPTRQG